jgi:steroid 5-alpha reductase family enzyme
VSTTWLDLAIALSLCLACSTLGFWRVVYFVSLSYALSIAAQALVFGAIFRASLGGWPLVQCVLLFAYGLRLGSYLLVRAQSPGFQKELQSAREHGQNASVALKATIWVGVSLLYMILFLPALLTMAAQARGLVVWSSPAGVVVMAMGLLLEGVADSQKSHFKRKHPERFCDIQLYRIVRCPNYLGEIIFWFGVWLAGSASAQTLLERGSASLGFLCIVAIMLGATRRLESKQAARYGSDPRYVAYASTVPVLFPLVPLYSLCKAVPPAE